MSSMGWQCWMCDKCGSPQFVCGKAVLVWWYFRGIFSCPSGARVLGGFSGLTNISWGERNCWNLLSSPDVDWEGWLVWDTQSGFIPPGSVLGAQGFGAPCSLSLSLPGAKVCDTAWGCLQPRDGNLLTKLVHVQKYSMTQSPDFFSSPHAKILPLLHIFISNSETPKRQ